ncbi:MAG: VOC family protein [Propionibacteriales bacterium]|nr:VOC family protein [Propionibacteriales bacterium]
MTLCQTIPALPVRDTAAAVDYYGGRLGFSVAYQDAGFAVLKRDSAEVHLWQAADEGWRDRNPGDRPVRSGAESFLAGTASCRIQVNEREHLETLYDDMRSAEVLHPVSRQGPTDTDFGSREFATLDLDGNLLSFFWWRRSGDEAASEDLS